MVKYNEDFKLKIVKEYQTGTLGYALLAKKYVIPDTSPIKKWVNLYAQYGIDGLKRKKTKNKQEISREQELERENELLCLEVAYLKN